ncbi:tetratricopeptide repeat-containing protein [Streptosporangiaceae bacterium NEAU-GS5]|nr:tetratricopeptide repeat-containing protein [Streptosporangiaceae bacterium NEAU-GS5]
MFDNAADVDQLAAWCPVTGAVRVLITSRNRAFHQRYAPIEVDTFTAEQAARFLAERTGLDDLDQATALAAELDYLPLALAQAAALIARRHLIYPAYRRLLADFPLSDYLPSQRGDIYPVGTAQAIMLSVVQAEATLPGGADLLRTLAVLSPAGVPRILLPGHVDLTAQASSADVTAAAEAQELLAGLADTSLISFSEDGSAVLMHRLVQRVLRERVIRDGDLPAAIDQAIDLLVALDNVIPNGAQTWAARAAVEILLEQTDALRTLTTGDDIPDRLLALRAWCGHYLMDLADLRRAVPLLRQTLSDRERILGTDHPNTLTSRNNLASAYQAAGDLTQAIPLYQQTLTDRERILGTDHPDTLSSRNNLATAYQAAGDPSRAIALHQQNLTDRERILGTDHPDTLSSRNNLAYVYGSAGDLTRAISIYQQTLADCERVLSEDHPITKAVRGNLDVLTRSHERK